MTAIKRLSAGVVTVYATPREHLFLLLRAYRHWDFPKGLVEPGENPRQAAIREVREETTLDDLEFSWGDGYMETGPYSRGKTARYYLAQTRSQVVHLPVNPASGRPEHNEYRWAGYTLAKQLVSERVRPILDWAAQTIGVQPDG